MKNFDLPSEKEYKMMVDEKTPGSKKVKGFLHAFWVGGAICIAGHFIGLIGEWIGLNEKLISMFTASMLVYLGTLLTGIGIYDKIAKFGGGGTLVPITGFANAVVSPAMEFKTEGCVLGLGVKIFTIAGPVIVYGVLASVAYGIIYWVLKMF